MLIFVIFPILSIMADFVSPKDILIEDAAKDGLATVDTDEQPKKRKKNIPQVKNVL